MGQDKFSRFKRVNWDNNWKATGSKLSGKLYGTNKIHNRHSESQNVLLKLHSQLLPYLSDWEKMFMVNITSKKQMLTLKQKQILQNIYNNYSGKTKLIRITNFYQF